MKIAHTGELQRILSLPRRSWAAEDLERLADEMTEILRTPNGTMRLRPLQALALHDAGVYGGLYSPMGTGDGKTLVTMLAPVVFESKRPLLVMPANLIPEKAQERDELAVHWRIPTSIKFQSYTSLGLMQNVTDLEDYDPDSLLFDEGHRLKNLSAAVTRRVHRFMQKKPETKVGIFTGSPMRKSILDYAHLVCWCLKTQAPVPFDRAEVEEWAMALDEDIEPELRAEPGALLQLCTDEERRTLPPNIAARRGVQRRIAETPGVVATLGEGEHVGAAITIKGHIYKVKPITDENFRLLRGDGTEENPGWRTPDGWDLCSGMERDKCARELALGLHYIWNPRPPLEWLAKRRDWYAYARDKLSHSRTLDTERQIRAACDAGVHGFDATALNAWRKIEPEYTPKVEAVWHDYSALEFCLAWMRERPGIVWTSHHFFAEELARRSGFAYYGAKGMTDAGVHIKNAPPGVSAIVSIDANREGRNLQGKWARNLLTDPPPGSDWWEQLMARTHRSGQLEALVTFDVMLGCREHYDSCLRAVAGAKATEDMTGKKQKLLSAQISLPSEQAMQQLYSPRWRK